MADTDCEEEDFDSDSDDDKVKSDDEESEAMFEDIEESDDELSSDFEPTPKKQNKKRVPAIAITIAQTAPKIVALLEAINEMKPEEKVVIFSQFTTFLDRIQKALDENGHTFTRIDGSMSAASRIQALSEFNENDVKSSPRFILCSLRATGTGINITCGNVSFLMDPWWNKAVEEQATERVHRLGQKRKVRVYSFVMKDSIEERLIILQKAKAALGKGSMEKLCHREERRAKLTAMKDLFEIVDVEDYYDSEDEFIEDSFDGSADGCKEEDITGLVDEPTAAFDDDTPEADFEEDESCDESTDVSMDELSLD